MSNEIMFRIAVGGVAGYLLGSLSFAIIISKLIAREDVRQKGSGNAGSTNMLRSYGIKLAALTFAGDLLKGTLAAYIGIKLTQGTPYSFIGCGVAGIAALVGHMKPIFFQFKGGKGVATALGVLAVFNPIVFTIIMVVGLPMAGITGYVSLAALICATAFPILELVHQHIVDVPNMAKLLSAVVIALLIDFNHRENFKRLLNGTERNIRHKKEN